MSTSKYKIIIATCALLFLPMAIVQLIAYQNWKKNKSPQVLERLEKSLKNGLTIVLIELTLIAFFFYHFGRGFIEVMGTFY